MLFDMIRDNIIPVTTGISVASLSLFLLWPGVNRTFLKSRIADATMSDERPRRSARAEAALAQANRGSSVTKWFSKLTPPTVKLARSLQMAGVRGSNSVLIYALAKLAAFILFGVGTFLYLEYIGTFDLPLFQNIVLALGGSFVGYLVPSIMLKNRVLKRQLAIQRAWPNALDLLLICVESGMGIDQAMRKVADEIGLESVDLAEEITLTVAELSYLPDRRQAFENLSMRTGLETVKSVVASLKQAERHGTSLGASLRVLSQENRDLRLSAAEKKAAALPPKLTVPMIIFFLPVLFAVIIAPAAMKIMAAE